MDHIYSGSRLCPGQWPTTTNSGHESSRELYHSQTRIFSGIISHPDTNLLGNYITPRYESSRELYYTRTRIFSGIILHPYTNRQPCDHYKLGTNQDPSVFPKPSVSCLINNLLCYYQFMGITEAGQVQEFRST